MSVNLSLKPLFAMNRLLSLLALSLLLVATTACDEQPTSYEPGDDTTAEALAPQSQAHHGGSALQKELAALRRATSQYQNVKKAEADGYHQHSPFIPGMGFHYVKGSLVDGTAEMSQPEALVYDSNDPEQKTRNLGAVEYIIPDGGGAETQDRTGENLPSLFTGQTSGDWHYESVLDSWTLHVWIWLDNPKGVFHPTNPRVNLDQ